MTRKEFDEHEFYAYEPFRVEKAWGFTGKTGRLMAVDFETGRLLLDMGDYLKRFKAGEVEPEGNDSRHG